MPNPPLTYSEIPGETTPIPIIAIDCPYCKVKSHFTPMKLFFSQPDDLIWVLQKCDNCNKVITTAYEHDEYFVNIVNGSTMIPNIVSGPIHIYPTFIPEYTEKGVPQDIINDFIEALKVFSIGAFNSTAIMCRRALQKSLIEKGATASKKLINQIEELKGKTISESLASWAHEIREIGNIGAHSDVYEPDVTEETAKDVLEFTREFLDDVYVKPMKIAERKNKRKP